jgi:hypothetical protein
MIVSLITLRRVTMNRRALKSVTISIMTLEIIKLG